MKQSLRASLCSAFVIPGLGQVLNRQVGKGLVLMAAITLVFIVLLLKIVFETTAILNGPNLVFGPADTVFDVVLAGMRARGWITLWVLLALGAGIWLYSVADAFYAGLRYQPPPEEED
ncbi:MAG: hypothetical protein AB1896_14830 [Thermodesulfobacteriota bacterium]